MKGVYEVGKASNRKKLVREAIEAGEGSQGDKEALQFPLHFRIPIGALPERDQQNILLNSGVRPAMNGALMYNRPRDYTDCRRAMRIPIELEEIMRVFGPGEARWLDILAIPMDGSAQ